ncbi:MAG: hypothetical protein RIQ60_2574 [Pseudomonadota bacterium]|jgi:error-prone DNA polymerase
MPEPAQPPRQRPALLPLAGARSVGPLLQPPALLLPACAELVCRSNFSFLSGASHPEELVARAAALGYAALALTDECSLAGVVRAHEEVKRQREAGNALQLLIGAEFQVQAGTHPAHAPACRVVLLAQTRAGYGNLCELISLARSRRPKGEYRLSADDLAHGLGDCLALLLPDEADDADALVTQARWLAGAFGPAQCAIGLALLMRADDLGRMQRAETAALAAGIPVAACGEVLMHVRSRKPLQDTVTAIRLGLPLTACGSALAPNAEQHLRSRSTLARLYRQRPQWLEQAVALARRCHFSLDELRYEYPDEIVPPGHDPTSWLRVMTYQGAARRYPPHTHPDGVPAAVVAMLEHELQLVAELRYEAFFLTVHDLVLFARSRGILCQGRGSAANSAVCYCLGITEVDPTQTTLLFERFISRERGEPPDIDVDFEHERREEVIQYLYAKYGRDRTALAAAVSTYRVRGAVREVGKALGLDESLVGAIAKSHQWFDGRDALEKRFVEAGLDPASRHTRLWGELVMALLGFPRHLSQHSGGFVIARERLTRLVPIEPAAMDGRQIIQWDKDDLESLGLLKVDVLALGMLTVLRKTLELANLRHGRSAAAWAAATAQGQHRPELEPWTLHHIPRDDPACWAMVQAADTVGTFQIESRAQMSMLPRLKPDKFYDLVIEVAIVRPGPIQGGMVHPYLRRKQGRESAASPYPALDAALGRTLGVPIFQEQVMQVCMIAAGFSPGEADSLRRAMAAWRRKGGVHHFHERIVNGMVERGYEREFAEGIFRQIQGFGEYGFPESHAYSFAILAWFSVWLKRHEPAAFLAALLNSQPMGFYGPSQLVQDARRHGVAVLPVDVTTSAWDCTLEDAPSTLTPPAPPPPLQKGGRGGFPSTSLPRHPHAPPPGGPAVRLGLRMVSGLAEAAARRLLAARADAAFADVQDLALRAGLVPAELRTLARADALAALAGHRREQLWAAAAPRVATGLSTAMSTVPTPGVGSRTGTRRATTRHARPVAVDTTAQPFQPDLLHGVRIEEAQLSLLEAGEGETITLDYAATGLTLRRHPVALLRERLARQGVLSAAQLARLPNGRRVRACGLVVTRQQPSTAKGTIFVTLEDETGPVNVIVWKDVREHDRAALLGARLLAVAGTWQRQGGVTHLIARRLIDASPWLGRLQAASRDFH